MTNLLKDNYRVGQILAVLFIVGIAISLFQVYSIPSGLSITSGYTGALIPVYIWCSLTFLLGVFTIFFALQNRREIIVFKDKNLEQDLADRENANTSQAKISLDTVSDKIKSGTEKEILQSGLQAICKQIDAGQGAIYGVVNGTPRKLELKSGYALNIGESTVISYEFGEGLIGQAAASLKTLYVDEVPEGYIKIISGLGAASPRYLLIVPLTQEQKIYGVMEVATFSAITADQRKFVEDAANLIAAKITTP